MQLGSDVRIPDGLLAEIALLREKPHQGVPSRNLAPHQGIDERNSTTAIGLRTGEQLNRIGPRYTGKERDTESGLDYFGARYYASNMGRFMSPDWAAKAEPVPYSKLDDPQTLNLYSYVGNNPLSRTDADGHDALAVAAEATPWLVECPICEGVLWGGALAVEGYAAYRLYQASRQAAPGSRPGQDFTRAGKRTIDQTNAAQNGGENKCNNCKKKVKRQANKKGSPTPDDQLQRHHIQPKAGDPPGSGTPENGEVLCPECHQEVHNPTPSPAPTPEPAPAPQPAPQPQPPPQPEPIPKP